MAHVRKKEDMRFFEFFLKHAARGLRAFPKYSVIILFIPGKENPGKLSKENI